MRLDAAAVVLVGLTCLESLTGPVGAFLEAHRPAAVDSLPARAVRPRRRRPASGVSRDDGRGTRLRCGANVWIGGRTWRRRFARSWPRVPPCSSWRTSPSSPSGWLRPAAGSCLPIRSATCRCDSTPAGMPRLRSTDINGTGGSRARRTSRSFPALPALMQPVGADHRLARAGRVAGPAHAPRAVGRRVHLARVVLRRADLPVAAEPAPRRRGTPRRRRRCCSPPIRSPRSSTRPIRKGCFSSAPSAPSITSTASGGSRRRCSGCSSA